MILVIPRLLVAPLLHPSITALGLYVAKSLNSLFLGVKLLLVKIGMLDITEIS